LLEWWRQSAFAELLEWWRQSVVAELVVEAECSCRVAGVVEALKNKRKNRNKKTYKTGQPT
jgi:hypothetical protein